MLDFDTINLDGSFFKDDPDSETEDEKENQTQIKAIKRNLHNEPPASSLDREIQIHHNRQAGSSAQSASWNHASNENNVINQNQMMETLAGAPSNILKDERRNPRDHQREVIENINSTIEELNEIQEEISKLP